MSEHEDSVLLPPSYPHVLDYLGGAAAALPFVVRFTTSGSSTVNGVVTSAHSYNWTALGGGSIALLTGLLSFALLRNTPAESRSRRAATTAVIVLLGAVHLVFRSGFLL